MHSMSVGVLVWLLVEFSHRIVLATLHLQEEYLNRQLLQILVHNCAPDLSVYSDDCVAMHLEQEADSLAVIRLTK